MVNTKLKRAEKLIPVNKTIVHNIIINADNGDNDIKSLTA